MAATIEMYNQINKNLLPIPSKFHYLFNLRDASKVFQGILMTKPHSIQDPETFIELWLHECQRVFMDRLTNETDREYFRNLTMDLLTLRFKENWTKEELF